MITGPAPHRYEALAAVTAGITVLALAPRPAHAARLLAETVSSSHDRWAEPTAPVLALVCLASWLLAGWLVLAALLLLAGRLPGLSGRVAAAVAVRVVPPAVRRCLEVVLGASLALTTVAALPAAADGPVAAGPAAAGTPAATDSLDWPSLPTAGQHVVTTPTPGVASTPRGRPGTAPAAAAGAPGRQVVVAPGDTLWALAERSLQARTRAAPSAAAIAATWPAWWAANREVIGDDPDLLLPGTPLRSP